MSDDVEFPVEKSIMESSKDLAMRIAEALNIFRQEHGDERFWNKDEWNWHDLLINKIKGA